MSEPGTPPLNMGRVIRKRRRYARKRKERSSSSDNTTSSRETSIDRKTKSRARNSRKRRRSSSSSSSVSSSPVRSKRSKRSKSSKLVRKHKLQSSRDGRGSSQTESSILKDLVAALENRNRVPQGFGSQNIIPEFDPLAKSQTMKNWLSKINESASVYGWSEKQTVFYALPRLVGLAKRWFDGLTSVKYTWHEWQEKLVRAFPDEENYADLLTEMLARKSRRNETLEEYYYDKIRLINRCEINGVKAVDCLTQGIYDHNIRMGAQGLCFKEPEELLTHFRKISPKREDYGKGGAILRERVPLSQLNRPQTTEVNQRRTGSTCFNCRQRGHFWQQCAKELIKCDKCKRVGHNATHCSLASNRSDNPQLGSNVPKSINKIESVSGSCNKYLKDVMVNGKKVKGFLDMGSECTLLSDEFLPDIVEEEPQNINDLPLLKGFASGSIKPKGIYKICVQIDTILEEVDAYLVPREMLPYGTDILIGQNLTELPGVRIYKTDSELVLFKAADKLAQITIEESVEISGATIVPVITSECPDRSNMFISSDVCLKPGSEYMILPGVYCFEKNRANIVIMGLNTTELKLNKGHLIARGVLLPDLVLSKQNPSVEDNRTETKNILRIVDQDAKNIRPEQINTDNDLSIVFKNELVTLLNKHREVFAFSNAELGKTNLTEMHIKLKDDTPVTYRPYRLSISEREKVKSMLEDLCANGIIRESESEYASPVIVVPKKNGELRLCVDYRALNKKTHKDKYPMPLIEDQIDSLCGQNFFTTLDLTSGYHQIPIAESSKHLTAFITQDGHFEYNRVPFGLCNAPAVFQRLIHKVLNAKKIPGVLAYMDDIVISSKTLDEGMFKLLLVLEALKEANLTLNLSKCHFFRTCIEHLGYEISSQGVKPGQKKTEAVASFKRPDNVHEVRQFIGLASFFRRFVPGFAVLARPLTRLTKANEKWVWDEAQEESFKTIKQILITRPVLAIYNPELLTELHTDASQMGIGGILMQRSEEKSPLRAVAYFRLPGLVILLSSSAWALRDLEPPAPTRVSRNDPVEGWLNVRLNHFKASNNATFRMRYYYNDEFAYNGNIVIFVGGEWAIHPAWTQGGLAYELAERAGAALFYTEHRYYGNTRPSANTSVEELRYLTVDQALGDLAQFIQHVKSDSFENGRYKHGTVGLVGCSYAGSMATWMKLGYPHLVDAAFSDSGPLHAQEDFPEYLEVITEAIRTQGSAACLSSVEQAIERMVEQLNTTTGPATISSLFNTCSALQPSPLDVATFFWFGITETFAYLVQYATPGDISDACAVLTDSSVEDPVQRLANWVRSQPYTQPCIETRYSVVVDEHTNTSYDASQSVMRLWTYQTCVEYGWYQTTTGAHQPFLNTVPLEYFHQMCRDFFSSYFDEQLLRGGIRRTNTLFAGRRLPDGAVAVAGGLDPWAPMGPDARHATERAPVYVVPTVSHCRAVQSTASSETAELDRAKRSVLAHMMNLLAGESSAASAPLANMLGLLLVAVGFLFN